MSSPSQRPASEVFSVGISNAIGWKRLVQSAFTAFDWIFTIFGEGVLDEPIRRVTVVDNRTGVVVLSSTGSVSVLLPTLQDDLDRLTVEEFCAEWHIEPNPGSD